MSIFYKRVLTIYSKVIFDFSRCVHIYHNNFILFLLLLNLSLLLLHVSNNLHFGYTCEIRSVIFLMGRQLHEIQIDNK
jgi:hypothetical protein